MKIEKDEAEVNLENPNSKHSPVENAEYRIEETPYNHQKKQESARQIIAFMLIIIIFVIIVFTMYFFWTLPLSEKMPSYVKSLAEILQIVFTPLLTLTSTAVGYYFGSNSK